jgi:glycosyltransferase involved in cell wall biosynthesis
MTAANRPLFSVIIPTRNRSFLFAVALQSVLEQRFRDFEVIVVNDGLPDEDELQCREFIHGSCGIARMLNLERTTRGHGPGRARNYGATEAHGDYLCFLDDDDQWTDPEHLSRAARAIAASPVQIDLLLANQRAFRGGVPVEEVIWIEDLEERMRDSPDSSGAYSVTQGELLRCQAHCHLNTTIVSRTLFDELGGLDEQLGYEEDRDFFLRAIDRAKLIKFLPPVVSRHNIPDPAAMMNWSTVESELSKRLFQLRVFDKAILFSERPELRRYGMHQRTYTLKHIATVAARMGQLDCAVYYARQALAARFTFAWLAVTALFLLRRYFAPSRSEGHRPSARVMDCGEREIKRC